ncbi:zinc finger protein 135-like [Dunckerocampus dactyliophorus]|uniref:zinc finger protein 135-like n=1 Tax=Dunckerocampus dactyliophorus TaxID=161453 RepID=UPI0024072E79|nr:zinc finger protein 135-like [Dunckerocampus dactyliophorus]
MASVRYLKQFVNERLTAAAEEIFGVFERAIVEYKEELDRQRRLVDILWKPQIKVYRIEVQHVEDEEVLTEQKLCKENCSLGQDEPQPPLDEDTNVAMTEPQNVDKEQQNPFLDQEEPETLQIKEEPCSSLEGEALDTFLSVPVGEENYKTADPILGSSPGESPSEDQTGCFAALEAGDENIRGDMNSKLFKCDCCGKGFRFRCKLRRHMLTHTGVKPYSCKTCGKTFNQRSNLKRHIMIHTEEKPYSCKTCGRQFRNTHEVLTHARTHTGEKPYPCNTCGKSFTQLSILKRHIMVHTGEKPFLCNTCGRSFSDLSVLKRHVMVHTGEKPYLCNICGKRFRANGTLTKHRRRVHVGEEPHHCPSKGNCA